MANDQFTLYAHQSWTSLWTSDEFIVHDTGRTRIPAGVKGWKDGEYLVAA